MRNNRIKYLSGGLFALALIAVIFVATSNQKSNLSSNNINVVAGENFWGSLVSQVGGNKVSVFSIVSDPNADPHEYESNANDARKVNQASYVIENGAGYDDWLGKLISANPSSQRKLLNVADLVGVKSGGNPHLWYSPTFVNKTVKQMELNLISIKPADKSYFEGQYNDLVKKLSVYQNQIKSIKRSYGGTKVAATEDIFYYLAQASGLNLISPGAFTEAVAEGNDPPADSVVTFQNQIKDRQPKLLVYNVQTVTPLTTSIRAQAKAQAIPVIGVSETIQPPTLSFENWMSQEVSNLNQALKQK
jgi:zinc/manganese transport system substrate-binding protein